MVETEPWTCAACHTTVSTPYCPGCGERPLRPRELTLRGLVDLLVQAFTQMATIVLGYRFVLLLVTLYST